MLTILRGPHADIYSKEFSMMILSTVMALSFQNSTAQLNHQPYSTQTLILKLTQQTDEKNHE